MKLEIFIREVPYADEVHLMIRKSDGNGNHMFAEPIKLTFKKIEYGLEVEPTLTLLGHDGREFLPALADALARSGYRAETPDASELKATKFHLEDMRRLVFVGKP